MNRMESQQPAAPEVSISDYTLRRLVIAGLWLSWIVVGTATLRCQEQPNAASTQPAITTDRPAITDSSIVVPRGSLLLENGFAETGSQGQRSYDFPETLVRFGLTSNTELRFTPPDYFNNFNAGTGFGSGFGDLSLGMKQQLVATSAGFDAALIVSLSFPTGANAISSHGYDPQLLLPWSHPVSKNWTAAGMFSLLWPTEGARRNLTGQPSFLLDRQITSRWDAFIEYSGDFPQRGSPQHLLHVGTALKITQNQQIDFHCGFGLSSAAVDHFIGFGYSFQLPAIYRGKRNRS
ncbi:MAG TPA: transporter [Terriglobales bacterium]|nr:transporter [Terriglobales bacterium]